MSNMARVSYQVVVATAAHSAMASYCNIDEQIGLIQDIMEEIITSTVREFGHGT